MNTIEQMCIEAKRKLKHSIHTSAGMHKREVRKGFAAYRKKTEERMKNVATA